MSRRRGYKRYSPEFKREALKRASEYGKGVEATQDTVQNLAGLGAHIFIANDM